eukprot:CAMPEP_0177496330 /NCGR_PEP_ID=MMETSP0369-20130122/34448_1 /TAXON_ID=447022 ORGANISM="Scrippsiella hangoei-like, Strain SHHI-4" /NCGR_SAMPLE_ID=MMETSP0369 /ASSEMBLY_ACC=CAM_ASM_000364 /LENGTH=33 /DNA_ID= /DNA_START= /DNA_END= /DNA_ORIENTATION=
MAEAQSGTALELGAGTMAKRGDTQTSEKKTDPR